MELVLISGCRHFALPAARDQEASHKGKQRGGADRSARGAEARGRPAARVTMEKCPPPSANLAE